MRAVVVHEFGPIDSHEIEEVAAPEPGADQILIDVHAIGLNFPDTLMVQGLYQTKPELPFVPGRDAVGVVAQVGDKVTRFEPGDRVAAQATWGGYAEQGFADAYVRPIAWRGSEMMGVAAPSSGINLAIARWEWPSYFSPEARLEGIRLCTATWRRPPPECAPVTSKAAGLYMIMTLAKHAALAAGYDDALTLDWRGRIAETTGANVFLVRNGELHTPIPDCFLDGITRRTVMELARIRGIPVVERALMPIEFESAEEVFVTGTAIEVTPVNEIDHHEFQVGPITRALIEDYDALVRAPQPSPA